MPAPLPEFLRPMFWEYRFKDLSWENDRDLITAKVLSVGTWEAIQWLRRQMGDEVLRDWICWRKGKGLSSRQLRFWETVLSIRRQLVNEWMAAPAHQLWEARVRR